MKASELSLTKNELKDISKVIISLKIEGFY